MIWMILAVIFSIPLSDHGLVAPSVNGGMVYVGTHGGGQLFAVDSVDGTVHWSRDDLGEHVTPVVIHDEKVLFGGSAGIFYAVDQADGETIWQVDVDAGIWAIPLLHEGVVYFGTDRGGIYALDADDGQTLWHVNVRKQIVADFVAENDLLYVAAGGTMYALSLADGELVWEQTPGARWATPVVQEGKLYVGSEDGYFYALDAATGDILWQFEGKRGSLAWAAATVADGVVYAGNRSNGLFALDTVTGKEIWRLPVENAISVSPPVVKDRLYVGMGDLNNPREPGAIVEVDPGTGEILKRHETVSAVVNALHIGDDGLLYAGTTTGVLYAIDPRK